MLTKAHLEFPKETRKQGRHRRAQQTQTSNPTALCAMLVRTEQVRNFTVKPIGIPAYSLGHGPDLCSHKAASFLHQCRYFLHPYRCSFLNVGVPDACRAIPCLLFILPFSGWILWGSWEAKCPSHTLSCGLFIFFSFGATYVSINLFAYYLSMYFLSLSSEVGTIGTDLP